jgi:MFS transporter, FSR family, fosmidomycin resistance protein
MTQSASFEPASSPQPNSRREWLTIGLVGCAHGSSHFYQLVIPSLFLPLGQAFSLDFAQLGFLMTVFFLVSGICQVTSGFVVDRIGPRPVLWFGVAGFVVSALLLASATGYATLLLATAVGGLANSVFHPADFSILNHRITGKRLGHAFSAHNLTGTVGWALAPIFVVGITALFGWRAAAVGVAILMTLVLIFIVWGRDALEVAGTRQQRRESPNAVHAPNQGVLATLQQLLASRALWGAFLFFCCATIALSAVQNFTIPLMGSVYGMTAVAAGSVLSGYMVGNILGMLTGGFLVNTTPKTEYIVLATLLLSAGMFLLLASGWVPLALAALVMALAGFFSGASAPSRDMMVRKVTPKQAVGSVYGLVYAGLDVGSALGPVLFGLLLDAGWARGPWLGAAAAFTVGALLARQIGQASRTVTVGHPVAR